MFRPTKKPMGSMKAARAIAMMAAVRGAIDELIDIGPDRMMDMNRLRTNEAAGNGFPFMRADKGSRVPISKITARLAKEMNCFINKGTKYTKKDDWMGPGR